MSKRKALSTRAETILWSVLEAGGSKSWWPDQADSRALIALENRDLIFCDDEAMRSRPAGDGNGLTYTLTENGKIAAKLVRP